MMAFAQRGLPLRLVPDWLALCDLTGRGPASLSRWSGRQKALETVSQRLDPFHWSNDNRQNPGLCRNEILRARVADWPESLRLSEGFVE